MRELALANNDQERLDYLDTASFYMFFIGAYKHPENAQSFSKFDATYILLIIGVLFEK
jgi:hypothetical protein